MSSFSNPLVPSLLRRLVISGLRMAEVSTATRTTSEYAPLHPRGAYLSALEKAHCHRRGFEYNHLANASQVSPPARAKISAGGRRLGDEDPAVNQAAEGRGQREEMKSSRTTPHLDASRAGAASS